MKQKAQRERERATTGVRAFRVGTGVVGVICKCVKGAEEGE